MGRYTGPKFRLDRREGVNLFLKGKRSSSPKHPIEKKGAVPPGQHGQRLLRRKLSDFGRQLREKQKVKRAYGILERQFRRYFEKASKEKGNTGVALLQILETRLDNVVYRLGFAPSRSAARQLVTHGHVQVNNKKTDIPSFNVKVGDLVSLSERSQKLPLVTEALELRGDLLPSWLNRAGLVGRVSHLPAAEDLEAIANEQLIVEYYSR
ncbi:MAG: 30S ribosomal protein S4 [Candidatus Woykebacteria bacterium GWB1_45_5]|uniref:Small ribosomal subunit protein uS4 n=2 Tax=Candidatus Woykeibacteriota TaxID=1817899 RepID=A0A1G1W2J3_9BACT|nr:MAG: 30S ribosomal protein S4 [Candidatus Woykebacteria bacterium GWA1_44_8]OGY23309.1 MAG: 30S ribosomal protein S4 [Candidatus Woykebacteria bacterium GWB1_45_5]